MEINQLKSFIAVAQYLNFTKAANSLYLTQSTISHNISELENELGVKLFYNKKNSVTLTNVGAAILDDTFIVDKSIRNIVSKIKQMHSGDYGELCVGYVFEPIAEKKIESFKNFNRKYPNVSVKYSSFDSITITNKIIKNELDVGFCRYITLHSFDTINWKHIYFDPLYIVMSRNHPLSSQTSLTVDMISEEVVILMNRQTNPGMFDVVNSLFQRKGYTPIINDSSNELLTTVMMAQIGLGIIILPGQFMLFTRDDLVFIPLEDDECIHDIGAAWNKNNQNPMLQPFLDELFSASEAEIE
jgi:DNA-binding transcriptional LysR family regulator